MNNLGDLILIGLTFTLVETANQAKGARQHLDQKPALEVGLWEWRGQICGRSAGRALSISHQRVSALLALGASRFLFIGSFHLRCLGGEKLARLLPLRRSLALQACHSLSWPGWAVTERV